MQTTMATLEVKEVGRARCNEIRWGKAYECPHGLQGNLAWIGHAAGLKPGDGVNVRFVLGEHVSTAAIG